MVGIFLSAKELVFGNAFIINNTEIIKREAVCKEIIAQ